MKADLRISVKDYRRDKILKTQLVRVPFNAHHFFVWMNGQPWPKDGRPVSTTRLMTALRKSLVKANQNGPAAAVGLFAVAISRTGNP
jgi:hypothetical protein